MFETHYTVGQSPYTESYKYSVVCCRKQQEAHTRLCIQGNIESQSCTNQQKYIHKGAVVIFVQCLESLLMAFTQQDGNKYDTFKKIYELFCLRKMNSFSIKKYNGLNNSLSRNLTVCSIFIVT